MRRRLLSLGLGVAMGVIGVAAGPTIGSADEGDRGRAREAYDRGALAHAHGDEATAARELALADSLVPSPVTLTAALESAMAADDAVLAITLCERSTRGTSKASGTPDANLMALVQRARARFSRRVGHLRVTCPSACSVTVDDARVEKDKTFVIAVGHHPVVIESDGNREERSVDIEPEVAAQISARPPVHEVPPVPPAPPRKRISSPAWFIAAASLTGVSTAVSIAFGVDASNRYNAFSAAGCTSPAHGDCTGLVNGGEAAQLRTNIMLAVTGVLGAGTVLTGLLTFRAPEGVTVAVGANRAVALRVPFP